jgi:hypothetical protein
VPDTKEKHPTLNAYRQHAASPKPTTWTNKLQAVHLISLYRLPVIVVILADTDAGLRAALVEPLEHISDSLGCDLCCAASGVPTMPPIVTSPTYTSSLFSRAENSPTSFALAALPSATPSPPMQGHMRLSLERSRRKPRW